MFSRQFVVECADPNARKGFIQVCTKNRSVVEPPQIKAYRGKKGYTKIRWYPDFERFGLIGYTPEWVRLFKKHAYDCAMVTGIGVIFNGQRIRTTNLKAYAKLFCDNDISVMDWTTSQSQVVFIEQQPKIVEKFGFRHISFVNGIHTREGGVHVDAWKNAILKPVVIAFNKLKSSKDSGIKCSLRDVEPFFMVFVRCELDKPGFESQSKHKLRRPHPKTINPTTAQINQILKWGFVQTITERKEFAKIKRSDGSEKSIVRLGGKADDANMAGTKRSSECVLYITEGHSAKTFAVTGISGIVKGRDLNGVFALKGKPINASRATPTKLNSNEEVMCIKKILGLRHGVDYLENSNFSTLRYGKVVGLCDQDRDGFHICGLLLNYFYQEYPTLIQRDYFQIMNTPIVKVFLSRNRIITFYSDNKFKRWQENNPNHRNVRTRYYKGLGTSKVAEAKQEFKDPKLIDIYLDGGEPQAMLLGFDEKNTNQRKEWLNNYDPTAIAYIENDKGVLVEKDEVELGEMSMTEFVNERLILYHLDNMWRSLPSIFDGLKESQRKVLYGCFKKRLFKNSVKVEQLAGYISENTGYHHGEASLQGAIIKMAQGYVGSNNIPLLYNDGQFGTRLGSASKNGARYTFEGGGDHGAARYLFTRLENIVRSIFPSVDDDLLDRVIDDNEVVEPHYYVPIIPVILVNGACGIASGYSTNIPPYHPIILAKWIKAWLRNGGPAGPRVVGEKNEVIVVDKIYPVLEPWWRGFGGEIEVDGDTVVTRGILEEEIITSSGRRGGRAQDKRVYHVKELPIGLWTTKFKVWVEDNLMKTGWITKMDDYNTNNTVHFILYPHKDYYPSIDSDFKILERKFRTSNMVALDSNRRAHRYSCPEEILEEFCLVRYELYAKRKEWLLLKLRKELIRDENRYRFIQEVMAKTVKVLNEPEEVVIEELRKRKYAKIDGGFAYLLDMSIRSMTKNKLEKLRNSIGQLKLDLENIGKKSVKEMWEKDLREFEKEYRLFIKNRED